MLQGDEFVLRAKKIQNHDQIILLLDNLSVLHMSFQLSILICFLLLIYNTLIKHKVGKKGFVCLSSRETKAGA